MEKEKGKWVTIRGRHVFIEDGQTLDDALKDLNDAERLLSVDLKEEKTALKDEKKAKSVSNCQNAMRTGDLPKGVKPVEYLGGTMTSDGKPVDMKKFKDGYLVSCGNGSTPSNKEFLLSEKGRRFIETFLNNSDDGEPYVGSWFENGENTNEPTIWVRDKDKAMRLARLTGQYAITDCAAYNKHGLRNYELPTKEQLRFLNDVFIQVCSEKEHQIDLKEVKI